jgi:hypothetical protein
MQRQNHDMALRLKFGRAKNGWLPTDLELDDTQLRFIASHIPRDFLLDLINALHSALRYEGTYVATVNEEPSEFDWTLLRTRDALVLTIIQYPDMRRGRGLGEKVGQASGTSLEVALPLWRGLKELESRRWKEDFKDHWIVPFPTAALAKLSVEIESMRPSM